MAFLYLQGQKMELHERQDIFKATTTKGLLWSKKIRQRTTGPNKRRGNVLNINR